MQIRLSRCCCVHRESASLIGHTQACALKRIRHSAASSRLFGTCGWKNMAKYHAISTATAEPITAVAPVGVALLCESESLEPLGDLQHVNTSEFGWSILKLIAGREARMNSCTKSAALHRSLLHWQSWPCYVGWWSERSASRDSSMRKPRVHIGVLVRLSLCTR